MMEKRLIVGVMGSAQEGFDELAVPLGQLIARMGCHLLTGGGGGVMAAVSRAFVETVPREGLSMGVIKGEAFLEQGSENPKRLYFPTPPNPWIEVPIYTHLPLSGSQGCDPFSRNHINVLSSDVLIALPGGEGTLSEVQLRVEYGKTVLVFLGTQTIAGRTARQLVAEINQEKEQVVSCSSCEEIEVMIDRMLMD
jgi:predicted Rossmann-fold nucleotide-binding protein